jgi:hypothetical protein
MSNPNFEIWKEPRGFLKCLQVFLAVFAFSCATGFRGKFSFYQKCKDAKGEDKVERLDGTFSYPFDTPMSFSMMSNCSKDDLKTISKDLNERHSTEFFVVIGVFCFLMSLGMLLYYIYFEDIEAKARAKASGAINWTSGPVVDFSMAVFYAFFWFVAAIAQAAAVNGIKDATNVHTITKSLDLCGGVHSCETSEVAKYATLTVSILLGFLNSFVWSGNCWFLWKETPWHKEPNNAPVTAPPHQQMPPAAI